MEAFAEEKETWLRGFLDLPNGIPSHDTLSDVLGRIDPAAFRTAFTAWATAALPGLAGEPVGVEGKTVRGSRDGENPAAPRVSAFAGQARWVLTPQAVAEKSNEITAIPDRLTLLDLHGAVVSIDAMGGQKAIAQTIMDGGADDVLTLKDNQPTLCEEVQLWLDTEVARGHLPIQETIEKDHGRLEIRRYSVSSQIDGLEAKPDWAGLQAVGRVESTRLLRHNGPRATVSAVVNSAPPSTMITGCACSSASPVRLPHSAIALGLSRKILMTTAATRRICLSERCMKALLRNDLESPRRNRVAETRKLIDRGTSVHRRDAGGLRQVTTRLLASIALQPSQAAMGMRSAARIGGISAPNPSRM